MKKEMTLYEMKRCLVSMLSFIDKWCTENNVRYYLVYGTLLGAIRHKGFIPWDDDIDIAMLRKDYDRFFRDFVDSSQRYRTVDVNNTSNYYLPFGKVVDTHTILIENVTCPVDLGVYIDVFPLDNMGSDINIARNHIKRIKILRDILSAKLMPVHSKRSFSRNLITRVLGLFPLSLNRIAKIIEKESKSISFEMNPQYVGPAVFNIYKGRDVLKASWFEETSRTKFEQGEYSIPKEYDAFLSYIYHDYMRLPPIQDQVSHHDYKVYYK